MTKNFINSATHATKRVPLAYSEPGTSSTAPTGADEQDPNSPSAAPAGHWLLICPPDNWKDPLPVTPAELRLLEHLSQRLGLVTSRDNKRKKLYLGLADAAKRVTLGYSSLAGGKPGTSSTAPTGANEPTQSSPSPTGTSVGRAGLRFPSRWTADVVPDREAGVEYESVDREAAAPLIPAFPDAQLSKNFRLSEFRPGDHNYDLIRVSPQLVAILEEIRERGGGQPLHITSAYRPPAYNRKVGGVSNSTHIDGLAADIYSDYLSTDELHDICDRVIGDKGGVGYYPAEGFVHIDLRGYRARWP